MNKKLLTVLTAAALVAALAACGENNPGGKQTTDTAPPASLTTQTEATSQTTEAAETTPPETTAPAPLPEVKDGTVYTKKAIDAFQDGSLDFMHSLTIPKIDSTKPGAEALNAKILAEQQDKLDALAANKEENHLYTVTYSTSGQTAFSPSMSMNTSAGSIPRAARPAVSTTMMQQRTAS